MATVQEAVRRLTIESVVKGISETMAKLRGLSSAQQGVVVTSREQEKATQSMERRLNSIQRQYDANYRATESLRKVTKDLNAAEAQGLITTQRKNELLRMAAARHRENTAATRAHSAALSRLRSVIAPLLTVYAALSVFRNFISNTIEAEAVQAQLGAALKSTEAASGQTIKSLNEQSAALQKVTAFGDETIGSAQSILLTFTRIGGEVFPRATAATLDLATRMKTDVNSAALQLGKALNDPIKGVTALARVGVQFSDSQKAMIESLVKTNQLAKAQGIILKELETEFGGSAAAARGTLGGAVKALGEAWGDMFEATGSGSDRLRLSIESIISLLQDPTTVAAVQQFGVLLFDAIRNIADGLVNVVNNLRMVGDLFANLGGNVGAMSAGGLSGKLREIGLKKLELDNQQVRQQSMLDRGDTGLFGINRGALEASAADAKKQIAAYAEQEAEILRILEDRKTKPTTTTDSGLVWKATDLGATADQIKGAERAEKSYEKLIRTTEQKIAASRLEATALGQSTEATARLRYEQELLNQAANDNLKLGPDQIEGLRSLAAELAATEESTRRLTEAYNFGKTTLNGFFSDLKSNLMNGTSLWDGFANAGANALNRIADKALGMAADGIWDMIFGALTGAISGGMTGGLTGGSWGNGLWGSAIFNAKGNVFSGPGISAYSNTIVDRPTVFPFAKGIGLMGEVPGSPGEAIMPLRRGADGTLGVTAAGAAANDNTTIVFAPVTNIDASGSNMTEAQFKALLDQRDRQWRDQLPALVKQIGANPRKAYV